MLRANTDSLNLETSLLASGALQGHVHCERVERNGRLRTECKFEVIVDKDLGNVDPTQVSEVTLILNGTRDALTALGESELAQEVEAITQRLIPRGTGEREQLDRLLELWRSRRLRVEPREFDRYRHGITLAMRQAKQEVESHE